MTYPPNDGYPFSGAGPEFEALKRFLRERRGLFQLALSLLAAAVLFFASYYQVNPDELGVVTRFGAYRQTTQPGLHFKIPIVDQVVNLKAKRQLKLEFGFRTETAGVKSTFDRNDETRRESSMLTGDLNVAVVEWIVHYKIKDPYQYLFKVRNVVNERWDSEGGHDNCTLCDLAEATMRTVVGDYSVTEVLTKGREEILEKVRNHLSELCSRYETGVTIQRIELRDSAPPDQVKPSFNEVNEAEQERDRLQNEAWSRYNQVIPNSRGEAKQRIEEAEGYAVERVNMAEGEVSRFLAIQKEYMAAPQVTRTRLYLETFNKVLPRAGKKVFLDEKAKGVMPLLFPAERAPSAPAATAQLGGAK